MKFEMINRIFKKIKEKIVYELTKKEIEQKREREKKFPRLNDDYFLLDDVNEPKYVKHTKWFDFLVDKFNHEGMHILEIGSREVTSNSTARKSFDKANYTGFDYHSGENVDVVGDVHKISEYFDTKFDLIYSASCFEHFAMPWQAAIEINKILKIGGHIFIETHFSYRSHERPWNFFQYSDLGLQILFSKSMGYECLDKGMSNPIVGRFSIYSDEYLRYIPIKGLYCHSEFLAVKTQEIENFKWEHVKTSDLVENTEYPRTTIMT
jgi:SAM-dependent methyltransferase